MFLLEIEDLNSQAFESVLDNELFYIVMDWNDSGHYWEMGIRNSAYITVLDGICVVPNYLLLNQFKYPDIPIGEIMAAIDKNVNGSPGRNDFVNKKFEFIYITQEDIYAL
jgi:hypothetical protein